MTPGDNALVLLMEAIGPHPQGATRRPRYFAPVIATGEDGEYVGLMGVRLPHLQQEREIAKALAARAMWRLGEGKTDYLKVILGDLYSGGALLYKRTGDGYVLYSVGMNEKDDGGVGSDEGVPGADHFVIRTPPPP